MFRANHRTETVNDHETELMECKMRAKKTDVLIPSF